jgi:hypothetical protein
MKENQKNGKRINAAAEHRIKDHNRDKDIREQLEVQI